MSQLRYSLWPGVYYRTLRTPISSGRSRAGHYERWLASYDEFSPVDLLLEDPVFSDQVEPAEYDLVTGRLNPRSHGE